jgi:putative aldouronate transport system permease protein
MKNTAKRNRMTKKYRMTPREALKELWNNKFLYIMMIPAIAWIVTFCYVPMYGILIAFKKFSYKEGILGSPWADLYGLGNFRFLFKYKGISQIFFNTIFLNVLFIFFVTVTSVVLAIMFVEIKNKHFKKLTQSIAILPHFVSWAVVAMFLSAFIGINTGLVTNFIDAITGERLEFYSSPQYWPIILVVLRIWQGAGYGTIVYIAAITGFDPGMYEAAKVDGATRFQQIRLITLPLLKTTIILLTIMSVGGIFRGDFGMIYALVGDNSRLYSTVDVIDTFTYRALRQLGNLGMSTATSFFQSVVGFIMVYTTNAITRKIEPESAIF